MEVEYSIGCEGGGHLVVYAHENGEDREICRGQDYFWKQLMFLMDQGEMHKVQEFSFQKGFKEAIAYIISEVELTQDQVDHIQEIEEGGTTNIMIYEVDYSNFY
jgi:hypothetical protein